MKFDTIGGAFLKAVAPRFSGAKAAAQDRIVAAVGPVLAETLAAYRIDTMLRIAHFTAQAAHESAGFRVTEEFASGSAYEGRIDLGNLRAGDGVRFKGRGLLQLTGRANYRRLGLLLGLPLEDEPQRAADPVVSLKIACEYWKSRSLDGPADADDLAAVTRRVNGGLNGLEDRRFYLQRAKQALAGLEAPIRKGAAPPVLRLGACGTDVRSLQAMLRERGYRLAADGAFGPATESTVVRFQAASNLRADGIVGARTWAALKV